MQIKFLSVGCGDAISIRFLDYNNQYRNILIDGGLGKMYRGILRPEIEGIVNRSENIDLWIVSHIDNDHIGGVLEFVKDKTLSNRIDWNKITFWFNVANEAIEPTVSILTTNLTSVERATKLRDFLKSKSILLENIIADIIPKDIFGAKFTILSPNLKAYNNLLQHWEKEDKSTSQKTTAKANDYKTKIEDFDLSKFKEDNAVPNGSSIAFLFEFQTKKILFLADSFPSIIFETLTEMGYSKTNKLHLDLMQVAHHGSKSNNSSLLLELIDCEHFVVSADAINRDNLPNKETLARYINHFKGVKVNFHFTHKNSQTNSIFSIDKDIKDVLIHFPKSRQQNLSFNYDPNE